MNRLVIALVLLLIAGGAVAGYYFNRQPAAPAPEPVVTPPPEPLPPDEGAFRWGVHLRPNAMDRYTDELMKEQLDLAKELGVGWVRVDWHNYNDFAWHANIIDMAAQRGMRTVLILEDIGVPSDVADAPAKARERAAEIVQAFKDKVRYYQLLNEVTGSAIKGAQFSGVDFPEHYNIGRYNEIRDWIKGAAAGIKEAYPEAKIIVSAQWVHTGMIGQLIRDEVPFDILGWNWFSDMPNDLTAPTIATTVYSRTTLLDKIRSFGKELWITELGHRPGESGQDAAAQAAYVREMTQRLFNYQIFKGLFYFELMDQSFVKAKGKPEYYGLVGFTQDTQGQWIIGATKQAFEAYKEMIRKLGS